MGGDKLKRTFLLGMVFVLWLFCTLRFDSLAEENLSDSFGTLKEFISQHGERIVSLEMREVPLSMFLMAISDFTGINFLASHEIENMTITLKVKNVRVISLLQQIMDLYSLEIEQIGDNLFVIKKKKEERIVTKVFFLKYAVVPGAKIIEKSKGDVSLTQSDSGIGSSEGGEGGLSGKGLFDALETVLSEKGVAICDPRTNSILVKDIVSNMPNVEKVIATLDSPVPQIMISVDMLDVSETVVDKLGIDWSNPLITLSNWSRTTKFPFLGRNLAFWGDAERTGTLSTVNVGGEGWALNFLRQFGDVRYLARPRIFTLNGETAKISISTDEAIAVNTVFDENRVPVSEEVERYKTGILLEVTPLVNMSTKEITVVVVPKLIETKPSKVKGMYEYRDPEERGIKTVVRVPDGTTIVLGGLIKRVINDTETRLPLLGKWLKYIFGSQNNEKLNRELLIFITPKIWDPSNLLVNSRDRSKGYERNKNRLEKMKSELEILAQMKSELEKFRYR